LNRIRAQTKRKSNFSTKPKLATDNARLARTTEAERIELYEITRGHPLLIEWLVGQLGSPKSQCHTIADACRFMESAPQGNDPLEFVFGDLLDTFTEHETAVLAALTYVANPAEVKWRLVGNCRGDQHIWRSRQANSR
jgi:hypothetical protein